MQSLYVNICFKIIEYKQIYCFFLENICFILFHFNKYNKFLNHADINHKIESYKMRMEIQLDLRFELKIYFKINNN